MTLSIVIPLFNMVEYVEETLQSIADQTRLPDELIIVDDGSTDDSLGAVRKVLHRIEHQLENLSVKIIELSENRGASHARNRGMTACTSDLIAFLDADDLFAPNFVEKALAVFERYELELLVLGVDLFPQPETVPAWAHVKEGVTTLEKDCHLMIDPLRLCTSPHFYLGFGCSVVKMHWLENETFSESSRFYENIDLYYRVLRRIMDQGNGRIGLLTGGFLKVRRTPNSLHRQCYADWQDLALPPALTRYQRSRDPFDSRLYHIVARRWMAYALISLSSSWQKILFLWGYRMILWRLLIQHFFKTKST